MPTRRPLAPLATALLALGVAAGAARADATKLRYEPGRWKTTTTVRMPMLPSPQERTSTECLREGDYSAERLMRDQQGCTVEEPEVTARSIRWTATCPAANGSATGRGEFTVSEDGQRGQGKVTIDMVADGQRMSMTIDIASERVGDCD